MTWREAFNGMTELQRRRVALICDYVRDPSFAYPIRILDSDAEEFRKYVLAFRWAEIDSVISSVIGARVSDLDNTPDRCAYMVAWLAERDGIDLDPIADAVLMGEEREFLDRLTAC